MKKLALSVLLLACAYGKPVGASNPVRGQVVDANGRPIKNATVQIGVLGGHRRLLSTSATGAFDLELDTGEYRITIKKKKYSAVVARTLMIHPGTNLPRYTLARAGKPADDPGTYFTASRSGTSDEAHYGPGRGDQILADVPDISQTLIARYGELRTPGADASASKQLVDSAARFQPASFGVGGELSSRALQDLEIGEGERATGLGNRFSAYSTLDPSPPREYPSFRQDWHFGVAGLFASPQIQKGSIKLGDWAPQFTVSSPLREHFWFSNTMNGEHGLFVVPELPKGQDGITHWQGSDALHAHFILAPEHALDFHLRGTYLSDANLGLSAFVPIYSTVDLRKKEGGLEIVDRYAFGQTLLLSGASLKYSYTSLTPQGGTPYILYPGSAAGSYFETLTGTTRQGKAFESLRLPVVNFLGEHTVQVGGDVTVTAFEHFAHRQPFQILNDLGQLEQNSYFIGDSRFQLSNTRVGGYVQDGWRIRNRILIQYGVRTDWDKLITFTSVAPRAGISYFPFLGKTKLFAYSGLYYPELDLALLGQAEDQTRVDSFYSNSTPEGVPQTQDFVAQTTHLRAPYYISSKVGIEQKVLPQTFLSASMYWLNQRNLLAYQKIAASSSLDQISLLNTRKDDYRAFEMTVRQVLPKTSEFLVSYRHSQAATNQLFDFSQDSGTFANQYAGPTDYDAPDRIVAWGWTPELPKRVIVSYMFEYRTGFPFTIYDQDYNVVGQPNQQRFPDFMRLNMGFEKLFKIKSHKLGIRLGVINITNHDNYTAVDNNISSPSYLHFSGSATRTFTIRVRALQKDQ